LDVSDGERNVRFGSLFRGTRDPGSIGRCEVSEPGQSQTRELIEESIKTLNAELAQKHISLNYSIDDDSDSLVVQVIEADSGKVIRQIPPDEILVLRQRLEELTGIIFDTQV
jgi:flagellar protein FlaG